MLRGINGQQIFVDSEDYEKFLEILKDCKAISEFEIFAYCLMGNHIHLLLKEVKVEICSEEPCFRFHLCLLLVGKFRTFLYIVHKDGSLVDSYVILVPRVELRSPFASYTHGRFVITTTVYEFVVHFPKKNMHRQHKGQMSGRKRKSLQESDHRYRTDIFLW